MWANWEMVAFSEGLYRHNHKKASKEKVGFYGMDVYSLWDSLDAIVNYLEKEDQVVRYFEADNFFVADRYAKAGGRINS